MSFQGVEFTPEMREMVVNVKIFFDDFKSSLDQRTPPATKLTASAIGVSESTVQSNHGCLQQEWDRRA